MWVVALVGMASSFVESTLAQVYKVKDGDHFRGGPAYYMEKALGARWMGIIFAVLITITFGLIFNAVQANTIVGSMEGAFNLDKTTVGIVLAVLTGFIIFGGLKRVVTVSQLIVPVMAVIYLGLALFVVLTNISQIPAVFAMIVKDAFGIEQIAGYARQHHYYRCEARLVFKRSRNGKRAERSGDCQCLSPGEARFYQTLGVFFDTMVICSATAFMILLFNLTPGKELDGIQITQAAMQHHVGSWAPAFVAVAIFLFAFSSIVGNYYYGETNIEFIKKSKTTLAVYRTAVVAMVIFGSVSGFQLVWDMADLFMGLMAIINLIAILLLSGIAAKVLKDYTDQRKTGKNPVFKASSIPGLKNTEAWEDEKETLQSK